MIRFGPSGNSEAFYAEGFKQTKEAPLWISSQGLNAFEYAFTLGQFLTDKTAEAIVSEGKKYDIEFSVHAPFYINFANSSETSKENNFKFMINSVEGLQKLGGRHCVFHIGSQMKMTRDDVLFFVLSPITALPYMKSVPKLHTPPPRFVCTPPVVASFPVINAPSANVTTDLDPTKIPPPSA